MSTGRLKHLAAAVRSTIAVAVTFGALRWSPEEIANVMIALELWGALLLVRSPRRKGV